MQQDQLIGTILGGCRILALIGQGGMARVYKAQQETLDRQVAVKILPPWFATDRSFVERFNLEARLVARLSHPNIVTVHDAGEQNGHLYIVMQLIDGGTLRSRLDEWESQDKIMGSVIAKQIFIPLADALSYAHERGIIHRDVKPVNVLMDYSGRPILSDFGIAKVLAGTQKGELTFPGAGVGTPEYMSPEQCKGEPVDGRADIYALGVMLFEAMTGQTPFLGGDSLALLYKHVYNPPPPPHTLNPTISPALEHVILTALAKDPAQRYQQAGDMASALEQAVDASSPSKLKMQFVPPLSTSMKRALREPVDYTLNTPTFACSQCRYLNKPQTRFCTRCGMPLNPCPLCGSQNSVNNRFCTKCGTALPA